MARGQGDQIGRIFAHRAILWAILLKMTEVAQIVCPLYSHGKSYVPIYYVGQKRVWATSWAIFSKTFSGHPAWGAVFPSSYEALKKPENREIF
jgi:hypothetical protein